MVMLFSSFVTPGANHAARSAHEPTLPRNTTFPPFASTVMRGVHR
jgi:hypothetical protein